MRALLCFLTLAALLPAQTITTAAGNSSWGSADDVVADSAGNLYITDSVRRRIYRSTPLGEVTVIAGNGGTLLGPLGGPATESGFGTLRGITLGPDGAIYFADYNFHRIFRLAPNGTFNVFAGNGLAGFTGDGGPATEARLRNPQDLAFDSAGNLLFTDVGNYRIRRITPAGIISTVAGTGRDAFAGDGGPPLLADCTPSWLAIAPDGAIFFTDDGDTGVWGNKRLRVIRNNRISTVAGTGVARYSGDGGPATAATFESLDGIAVDAAGNLFIAEYEGHRVRRINPAGIISTYAGSPRRGSAGDGGPASLAQLNYPFGLTLDAAGHLLIADSFNARIRRVALSNVTIPETNSGLPSFLGRAGFASNSYLEIYGNNLSTTTRTWAATDFVANRAPTSLDGVSVSINGRPAFVYFVSPTQINVNTPEDTATGPVSIIVTNSSGASNVGFATRARLAPTLHANPAFGRHVVAQTPDFRSFIGPPGLITGLTSAPARPGDTIIVFALGCGPTTPATTAGVPAAQNSRLALPFTLRIGGRLATVPFAGALAGAIGLYQFNIVVPDLPPGDHPIELTLDGLSNQQDLILSVTNSN